MAGLGVSNLVLNSAYNLIIGKSIPTAPKFHLVSTNDICVSLFYV